MNTLLLGTCMDTDANMIIFIISNYSINLRSEYFRITHYCGIINHSLIITFAIENI